MSNRKLKFYSVNDMATGIEMPKFINFVNDFNAQDVEKISNIDELLELYNVLLYVQEVFIKNAQNGVDEYTAFSRKAQSVIKNSTVNNENQLLDNYKNLSFMYQEDFWGLVNEYGNLVNIKAESLEELLNNKPSAIRYMLNWKYAKNKFSDLLSEMFVKNPANVQLVVDKLERQPKITYIPRISRKDFNKMIVEYLDSPNADYSYLEKLNHWKNQGNLIIDFPVLNRLSQRVKEIETEIFQGGYQSTYTFQILPFKDNPSEFIRLTAEDTNLKIEANQNVLSQVQDGIDYLEFLRNWPLFFSRDETFSVLRTIDKSDSLFELFQRHYADEYEIDDFSVTPALVSIQGFEGFRDNNNDKSLLESVEAFIDGLHENYGVTDFEVQLSSKESSYYTRLKIILPEIEKLVTQFEVLKVMGETAVDDLKRIGVNKSGFTDAKSLYETKFYEPANLSVLKLLFKKRTEESMGEQLTIANQLHEGNGLNDSEMQGTVLNELINSRIINEKTKELTLNEVDFTVLERLWQQRYITYFGLSAIQKNSAMKLVDMGLLTVNNNLFSSEEVKFISYVLDDKKYSNGLSVRNSILHGNISSKNERFNQVAYYYVLLVLLLIIVRLKDEFEYFDGSKD